MLDVRDLASSYGSGEVVAGVSFSLRQGEVVSVLGRNGVGKTTLMKTLMGLVRPTRGQVLFHDADLAGKRPDQIARSGIAYVPQGRGIFGKLSVMDNLRMGTRARRDGVGSVPEAVFDYFPILRERQAQLGGTLSGGQQQQLAIGRALCGAPDLLLLDEPSEGIQPNIVQQIGAFLRKLVADTDIAVLLVEQNLDLGLTAADRCLVMEKGRIVHQCLPDEFRDEAILKKYLAI